MIITFLLTVNLFSQEVEKIGETRDIKYKVKVVNVSPQGILVDELREQGVKAGLLKIRMFRPFPAEEVAEVLKNVKAIAVLDKADSLNAAGGALFEDVVSGMYVANVHVPTVNYIYGIGGRDTTVSDIKKVYNDLNEVAQTGNVGNPYRYLGLRGEN